MELGLRPLPSDRQSGALGANRLRERIAARLSDCRQTLRRGRGDAGRPRLRAGNRVPSPASRDRCFATPAPIDREIVMSVAEGFTHPEFLIDTDALERQLGDPNLRVFDCTTILIPDPKTKIGRAS